MTLRRDVMTTRLYGGEASHTFCRQNCHQNPKKPVRAYWSPWFAIQVSALAFILVVDAILILSL